MRDTTRSFYDRLAADYHLSLSRLGRLADVRWRMPKQSGYFQPLVTARMPAAAPDHLATPPALL